MNIIDNYLAELISSNGSDLLIVSEYYPTIRKDGFINKIPGKDMISAEKVSEIAKEIVESDKFNSLKTIKNFDFAYETVINNKKERFRCNMYIQKNGINIEFRFINSVVPSLEDLQLPSAIDKLINHHQGLVLATGAAGCGKSSTMAALLNIINHKKDCHIITVEDPIEFIFPRAKAHITQRQVGKNVDSFQTALRAALREDPDVIFVGEMRDLETIQMAITAAETGHLVLATLHTNSASKTVDRLVGSFPIEQQSQIRTMVSESLRGIISQQLIPRADGNGRVPAVEILIETLSIANLIRKSETFKIPSMIETGSSLGMISMDNSVLNLCKKGIITKEEAADRLTDQALINTI